MAATYVSGSAVGGDFSAGADPWSITGPTGAAAGDWVIVAIEHQFSAAAPDSVPSGFIAGPTPHEGTTDGQGRFYHGPFNTVGAGPYSWGWPASTQGCAVTLAIRGADPTTPLNVASTSIDFDGASSTNWTCTGQTTTVAGCCVVGFGGCSPDGVGRTWAITAGTTQRLAHQVTSHQLIVGTLDQTSAGSVTTAGTVTVADKTYGVQYAFAPAPPGSVDMGWPASESLGMPQKSRSPLPMVVGPREDRIYALQHRRPGA